MLMFLSQTEDYYKRCSSVPSVAAAPSIIQASLLRFPQSEQDVFLLLSVNMENVGVDEIDSLLRGPLILSVGERLHGLSRIWWRPLTSAV